MDSDGNVANMAGTPDGSTETNFKSPLVGSSTLGQCSMNSGEAGGVYAETVSGSCPALSRHVDEFCCVHPSLLHQASPQSCSMEWTPNCCSHSIQKMPDFNIWLKSDSHRRLLVFVQQLSDACKNKRSLKTILGVKGNQVEITPEVVQQQVDLEQLLQQNPYHSRFRAPSPASQKTSGPPTAAASVLLDAFVPFEELPANSFCWQLLHLLQQLLRWAVEIEPQRQPARFGNPAFRTWSQKMQQEGSAILFDLLKRAGASRETASPLVDYFCSSFGSPRRLDFGTGHETSFVMFLFCAFEIGVLEKNCHEAFAALGLFKGYVELCHCLQRRYCLEAAGSRGVWGLDDFHFLTFLFGASQLSGQQEVTPGQIQEADLVEAGASELLYFDSIMYILKTKRGAPFHECAPILYNISGLNTWHKITAGLMRMYDGEVLCKFPIAQHFLFCHLFPLE